MSGALLRHVLLGALIVAAPASITFGAESYVTVDCPAYVVHMRNAGTNLERGNRRAADAELRQAKAALEHCLREQVSETALAAAAPANDSLCD